MFFLTLRVYVVLIVFDLYLATNRFPALYRKVRESHPPRGTTRPRLCVEEVCHAVELACVWYPKQVLCLQRSAATAFLLKRFGAHAQMVIGAQRMPMRAHAWVEVDGRIVNDKSYIQETFTVMDRC